MIKIPIIKDAFKILAKQYTSLGDYSATTIIDSPRRVALYRRHQDKVEVTPESMAASVVGTALHEKMESLLKMANVLNDEYMVERSVVHPVTILMDKDLAETRLLSGRFDILYRQEHLYDIKCCKTWKLIFDPYMTEWVQQQNIYAWLLMKRGIEIDSINIIAFFLDWVESQSKRDDRYPNSPIVEYNLPFWPYDDTRDFIRERLKAHIKAEYLNDDELPFCTREEMWQNSDEYALFKDQNAKRATKVFKNGTLEDAIKASTQTKGVSKNSFIEIRRPLRKRCEKFCPVNVFCNQHKSLPQGSTAETFSLDGIV